MTYFTRLVLDLRSRGVRQDVFNPYSMHATLERAVNGQGRLLWRQEQGKGAKVHVYVQHEEPLDPSVLQDRSRSNSLSMETLAVDHERVTDGSNHRFRLVANPTVIRNNKRKAVVGLEAQYAWIHRKAEDHGFKILSASVSGESMVRARPLDVKRAPIEYLRVVFDGHLRVTNREIFVTALEAGIGRSKAFGCGLLTIDRIYR